MRFIFTALVLVLFTSTVSAYTATTSTTPDGYVSRAVQMYNSGNYNGAIDQLSYANRLLLSADEKELADYLTAKSYYQKGDIRNCIVLLNKFVKDYPASLRIPDAYATLGDIYFYNGRYAGAVPYYKNVNREAFSRVQREDITYRLAYSCLKVKEGDKVSGNEVTAEDIEGYRAMSGELFGSLDKSSRYGDAGKFYRAYIKYEACDYDSALVDFAELEATPILGYNSRYYICQIQYIKGNYENVIEQGVMLLSDGVDCDYKYEINRIVGESYFRNGEDDNATNYLGQYLETIESEPMLSAQYVLGVLDYRNGEYSSAIEQLTAPAQEDNIMGQSAYYYLGQAYRKQGNIPMATMALEKAAKMTYSKETQEAAFYNFAVIQSEGGQTPFSKAIDMFEDFLVRFPESRYADEVSERMVALYVTGKDYSKALASISRIKSPGDNVLRAKQVVLYNLGVEALSNDDVNKAQTYFKQSRALAKYNKSLDAQNSLWLGECAFRKGDFEEAAKYQNEYLKGVNSAETNYALGYYNLGYSRFQQRKYEAARNAFKKAVTTPSFDENLRNDAYNRIGDTYYYNSEFKAAESYYDKSTGDYSVYQKGIMLGLSKKHEAKVKKMQELIEKYPSSSLVPMAMLEQADAYVSMNKNKRAIEVYNNIIAKFPENAYARKAMLNKAITERNSKHEASAIEVYKDVIAKYPASEEAAIALEDLTLIYADKGELTKLSQWVATIKNAPKLDVNDIDRLTFEAAEKAYMNNNNDIAKMNDYLKDCPNGVYVAKAKYYVAKYNFNNGKENDALTLLGELENSNADASFMEDVLAMKAAILTSQGENKEALAAYKKLAAKASNADTKLTAQLGILRAAVKIDDNNIVVESAVALLKQGGLTAEEEKEVTFARANAYKALGKTDLATKDYSALANDARNLYGAKSAVYLAEMQYNAGKLNDAENTLNALIDAGTPHQYWLARGFILLADVYYKQGNSFEACEYLESLKSNYPGEEKDIFKMIDDRLSTWKK